MPTTTLTEEVIQLERNYWQAIRDGDLDAALALTDDPCIVAGSSGPATIDRTAFAEIMKRAEYRIHDVAISDIQTRQVNDDLVLMAYKVREDLTVDGKPVSFQASDASVWVRRDGQWRCAMHTEAILGDAFGRDRTEQDAS